MNLFQTQYYLKDFNIKFQTNNVFQKPIIISIITSSHGLGASGGEMVCKLDKQTYTSEFGSHWVPYSCSLVPNQTKMFTKLLFIS